MELFSLKQCVFTEPEGKVDKVTQEKAAGGLQGIRFSFKLTKKCWNTGWMEQESCVLIQLQLGYETSNQFCISKVDRVWN